MKSLGYFFSEMFRLDATSKHSFWSDWDKARADASRFGPSHVAEVDAIFSRQA